MTLSRFGKACVFTLISSLPLSSSIFAQNHFDAITLTASPMPGNGSMLTSQDLTVEGLVKNLHHMPLHLLNDIQFIPGQREQADRNGFTQLAGAGDRITLADSQIGCVPGRDTLVDESLFRGSADRGTGFVRSGRRQRPLTAIHDV